MTVCIAALCKAKDARDTVVLVSDRLLTYSGEDVDLQSDRERKTVWLSGSWRAMYTTNDSLVAANILRRAKDLLTQVPEGHDTIDAVMEVFETAYRVERQDIVMARLGLVKSPEESGVAVKMWRKEVREVDGGTDFIVCGFHGGEGHLFLVVDPGKAYDLTKSGFLCAGCGVDRARSAMNSAEYDYEKADLSRALCCAMNAKMRAEEVQGVGRTTDLLVIRSVANQVVGLRLGKKRVEQMEEAVRLWQPSKPTDEALEKAEEVSEVVGLHFLKKVSKTHKL